MNRLFFILLILTVLVSALVGAWVSRPWNTPATSAAGVSATEPELILWVWQREEDLSFITPGTSLGLWIATITLDNFLSPEVRRNPVLYPQDTRLIGVVRLEAPPAGTLPRVRQVADAILAVFTPTGADELQIDFDAALSQRDYYRALLRELAQRLDRTPLSITALASWCLGDPWIDGLPVDYAVPMLYRMGQDTATINQNLAAGGQYSTTICDHNAGYSLDAERVPLGGMRRIFVFNDNAWDRAAYESIKHELFGETTAAPTP